MLARDLVVLAGMPRMNLLHVCKECRPNKAQSGRHKKDVTNQDVTNQDVTDQNVTDQNVTDQNVTDQNNQNVLCIIK